MNAFLQHGEATARRSAPPRQVKQERAPSPIEKKMLEKQRLSRSFRAWRRAEVKRILAEEPRLGGFLRFLRRVTAETGDELLESLATCDWLRAAPQPVRIFALRMISIRCDRINRGLGNAALDDPVPPETSIYFEARQLLHEGGRG